MPFNKGEWTWKSTFMCLYDILIVDNEKAADDTHKNLSGC